MHFCRGLRVFSVWVVFYVSARWNIYTVTAQTCAGDTTPPVFTCVNNVTTDLANPTRFFAFSSGIHYNLSDTQSDVSSTVATNPQVSPALYFPPGDTSITLTGSDACENEATCVIIVTNPLTELPVECPDLNATVSLDPGQSTYSFTPSYSVANITLLPHITSPDFYCPGFTVESCNYRVDISVPGSPLENVPVGMHEVVVVISDDFLNKTCISYLTVADRERPNLTCPQNIIETTSNVVSFSAIFSDNVDSSGNVTYSPLSPGSQFPLGITEINVIAHDSAGNNRSCQFTVDIAITELPVQCPNLDSTVQQDPCQPTFSYTSPYDADDVMPLDRSVYRPYGGSYNVDVSLRRSSPCSIPVEIVTVISDDFLSTICISHLTFEDNMTEDRRRGGGGSSGESEEDDSDVDDDSEGD